MSLINPRELGEDDTMESELLEEAVMKLTGVPLNLGEAADVPLDRSIRILKQI